MPSVSRWSPTTAAYTAGQVMLETADRLVVEEGEPAVQQYLLLVGALGALNRGTSDGARPASLILDSYLLRSLAVAGYAPTFTDCARCGVVGPHRPLLPRRRRCRLRTDAVRPGSARPLRRRSHLLGRTARGPLGRYPAGG